MSDLMGTVDRMGLCTAKSKQGNRLCKQHAIPGGTVCHYHGGGAPQVKAKARERLAALVDPAITTLGRLVSQSDNDHIALAASKDVLDRTGYGPDQVQPQDNRTLVINMVNGRPQEDLREIGLGLLKRSNGNGHR